MIPKSKILIIAGSDSSGGAGIQADIKTVTSLGGYAMTAITAITSQNTTGVKSVFPLSPKEAEKQIVFTSKGKSMILTLQEKTAFLENAVQKNFLLIMEHDPYHELVSLQLTEKGVRMKAHYNLDSYFST